MKIVVAVAIACASCATAPPPPAPTPRPNICQEAIAERNVAVMAEVDVCATLGGPDADKTGACKAAMDAAHKAQSDSVKACTDQ